MEHSACGHGVLSMSRWLGEKQRGWAGAGPDPGKGLHRRPAQDPEGQRAPLGSTGWGESRGGWNPSVRVYLSQWRGVGHTTALRTRTRRPSNGVSRAIWGGGGEKAKTKQPQTGQIGENKEHPRNREKSPCTAFLGPQRASIPGGKCPACGFRASLVETDTKHPGLQHV